MVDKNEKKREFFEAKKIIEENIENHDDADANETQRFEAKCPNVIFLLCVIEQVISDYKEFQLLKKEGASPLKPPNQETFVNFSQKLAEPPFLERKLLSSSYLVDEEQCPLISELYDLSMQTSSFFQSGVDGYVKYSVCRLKHYLNETHWDETCDKMKGFDSRRRLHSHAHAANSTIKWWESFRNRDFERVSEYVAAGFIELAETQRMQITWRKRTTDVNLWQCDLDKVLCKKDYGLGLRNAAEISLLGLGGALVVGQFLKLQFLNILTMTLFLPLYGFVFVAMSHEISPACFPHIIPVCLVDDAIDNAESMLTAKRIAWDKNLVQKDEAGKIEGILDCKRLGFSEPFVAFEYYLQQLSSKENVFKRWYYNTFAEARRARDVLSQNDEEHVSLIRSCARLNALSAVSLVLLFVFAGVVAVNFIPSISLFIVNLVKLYSYCLRSLTAIGTFSRFL